jgi:hypothetical protein
MGIDITVTHGHHSGWSTTSSTRGSMICTKGTYCCCAKDDGSIPRKSAKSGIEMNTATIIITVTIMVTTYDEWRHAVVAVRKRRSLRRMPEWKVREELRQGKLKERGSCEELEHRLHNAVERKPCCWRKDCPCMKIGIGFQDDTCSYLHASHNNTGASSLSSQKKSSAGDDGWSCLFVKEKFDMIQYQCGNRNGMYVVNFEKIHMYREQYVNVNVVSDISEHVSKLTIFRGITFSCNLIYCRLSCFGRS